MHAVVKEPKKRPNRRYWGDNEVEVDGKSQISADFFGKPESCPIAHANDR